MKKHCIPKSYVERECCANCGHVFIQRMYDEGPYYFCHVDNSERPPCNSVLMGEMLDVMVLSFDDPRYDAAMDAWDEWSECREVIAWGYCDSYVKKEKNE